MITKEIVKEIPEDTQLKLIQFGNMEYVMGESLMLFGQQKWHGKSYRLFYGVGVVYRVVKGEKADLVYVRFGCFPSTKARLVVVYDNRSRRQTMTLKRGQTCQVYGIARNFRQKLVYGSKTTYELRLGLYARGINGWYTPTMLDIRKMPINEDVVEPSEKEKETMKSFEEVLNEFMNGNGEEE